jgi:hypothetical protein
MQFSCQEHKNAFDKLTERQKQYISAYMETGSPTQVGKLLGLSGSPSGVSKKLLEIAKAMGLKSVRELGAVDQKKRNQNQQQKASAGELLKKVKSQRFRCALSGVKLVPETAQLDHIVPLSNGGTNDIENLQWLDARVNKAKGTMSQAEFIKMCKQVAQWTG